MNSQENEARNMTVPEQDLAQVPYLKEVALQTQAQVQCPVPANPQGAQEDQWQIPTLVNEGDVLMELLSSEPLSPTSGEGIHFEPQQFDTNFLDASSLQGNSLLEWISLFENGQDYLDGLQQHANNMAQTETPLVSQALHQQTLTTGATPAIFTTADPHPNIILSPLESLDHSQEELDTACQELCLKPRITSTIVDEAIEWQRSVDTTDDLEIQLKNLKAEIKARKEAQTQHAINIKRLVKTSRASSKAKSLVYKTIFKRPTHTEEENAKLVRKVLKWLSVKESASRTSPAAEHV